MVAFISLIIITSEPAVYADAYYVSEVRLIQLHWQMYNYSYMCVYVRGSFHNLAIHLNTANPL